MPSILKLDFNERSDKVTPLLKKYSYDETLWQYPDRQPLEQKLAELNQVSASQVLCTNGGDEAIMILMRLIKETSQVILPLPAFSQYNWGVKSWQLDAQLITANSDLSIDLEATINAIRNTPGCYTIITRPNNPTGESIPLKSLLNLIETASQNKSFVFLDEAYIEFSEEKAIASSLLNQFDNLVILRTLSKAYGLAGIRLGYLLGNESLIKQFKERCAPFNIPQPSLAIAMQALTDDNRDEVVDYCQQIVANRNQLINWLATINISVLPSQANFIMLQLPKQQAQAVHSFLARNNVLVRDFSTGELANCLRITIPANNDRLIRLLQQALAPDLICLDMDGVLIDTSGSYDETIKATVRQLSGKTVTQSDIHQLKDTGGFNNDWVVSQQLLENCGVTVSFDKVVAQFQQLYLGENNDGFVANETPIISPSLISSIKKSTETQFAIVTGRPRNEAVAGRDFLTLNALAVISLDDVEQAKPSPEGINKLQSSHSELSWMCGDNPDDMQAAVASNSLAIGIGDRNSQALYEAGADIVLADINQLEDWLKPIISQSL